MPATVLPFRRRLTCSHCGWELAAEQVSITAGASPCVVNGLQMSEDERILVTVHVTCPCGETQFEVEQEFSREDL